MNLQEYKKLSQRTLNKDFSEEELISNMYLGIIGECGEVVDILKKIRYHNHPITKHRTELKKEIGDIFWYLINLATLYGVSIDEVDNLKLRELSLEKLSLDIFNHSHRVINNTSKNTIYEFFNSLNNLIHQFDLSLDEILQLNIEKLLKRYPEGFNFERSIKRNN